MLRHWFGLYRVMSNMAQNDYKRVLYLEMFKMARQEMRRRYTLIIYCLAPSWDFMFSEINVG